ncbi:hypothetical protein WA577_004477 [Blastocystis sp. JDR]
MESFKVLVVGDLCSIRYDFLPSLLQLSSTSQMEYFLTDLSNPETPLSSLFQNYAFVLFFVDMQNERTWRICRKGIVETPISYALLKSCLVVKDLDNSIRHAFSGKDVADTAAAKNIQLVSFSNRVCALH